MVESAYFPILTPQQANPAMTALSRTIQQHLQNMNTQAQTQGLNLQNQRAKAMMPYVVPQAQAQLQGSQLSNQRAQDLLPFVTPGAQAGLQSQQLGNQRDQLANQLAKALMPSQIQGDAIDNRLKSAQADYYENGGSQGGAGVDANRIKAIERQLQVDHNDWTPEQINDATNQYLLGRNTFSDGTPLPPLGGIASNLSDVSTKSTNTAQGNNQINYASMLDAEFNQGDKLTNNAFSYAGLGGQTKLAEDIARAATPGGTPSPEYTDYKQFTEQVIPSIAAEIIRTEGANSTDGQKALAILQANPIGPKSNPVIAKQQWEQLKSLYGSLGKVASTSLTQKKGQLQNGYGNQANNDYSNAPAAAPTNTSSNVSEQKIQNFMKKHPNVTRDEAIDMLGGP